LDIPRLFYPIGLWVYGPRVLWIYSTMGLQSYNSVMLWAYRFHYLYSTTALWYYGTIVTIDAMVLYQTHIFLMESGSAFRFRGCGLPAPVYQTFCPSLTSCSESSVSSSGVVLKAPFCARRRGGDEEGTLRCGLFLRSFDRDSRLGEQTGPRCGGGRGDDKGMLVSPS
jgi:hypothetical protein